MLFDLMLFNSMFPNYNRYRVPMWSTWKEKDGESVLEIAIPGYDKDDFVLCVEDGDLILDINSEKRKLTYSVLSKFYTDAYQLEKAKATYSRGILTIKIPKSTKNRKKIEIEVS